MKDHWEVILSGRLYGHSEYKFNRLEHAWNFARLFRPPGHRMTTCFNTKTVTID